MHPNSLEFEFSSNENCFQSWQNVLYISMYEKQNSILFLKNSKETSESPSWTWLPSLSWSHVLDLIKIWSVSHMCDKITAGSFTFWWQDYRIVHVWGKKPWLQKTVENLLTSNSEKDSSLSSCDGKKKPKKNLPFRPIQLLHQHFVND